MWNGRVRVYLCCCDIICAPAYTELSVKGKWRKARPTVMHVYGLRSLQSIFRSSIHPIVTSVYIVLKKRRCGSTLLRCIQCQLDSDVAEHWSSVAANHLDVRVFVYLSFAVVCSTGEWLLGVPLMVPLEDTQIGSWWLKVKWCRSIHIFPWLHTVT